MDLKATQDKLLDLMISFDKLCREHDIHYSLHGGTMLGAIREKGFIPWDDDMDIAMTRQEYEKLCQIMQEAPSYHLIGKIKKQFRRIGEDNYWVDIFVCDPISEKKFPQKAKLLTLTVLDVMSRDKHSILLSDFSKHSLPKRIAFRFAYWCGKLLTSRFKVRLYEAVSQKLWTGNKTLCVRGNDQLKGRKKLFPAQWMTQYVQVPFAHTNLMVSSYYHELLTSFYGESYMTPVKDDRNSQVHDLVRASGKNSL